MCGIFGCLRNTNNNDLDISNLILTALNLLKNRGYDSCGVYIKSIDETVNIKFGIDGEIIKQYSDKNIFDIFELLNYHIKNLNNPKSYYLGLGHTRWATHGGKTDHNSHPHISNDKQIILVHNGIISNNNELKLKYLNDYIFYSNTDTEVIVNMIQYLKTIHIDKNFNELLIELSSYLEGTWACIIFNINEPERLYFIKR